MKIRRQAALIFLILNGLISPSCNHQKTKVEAVVPDPIPKRDASSPKSQGKPFNTDTLEFMDYNDDGDYTLLNARKGDKLYCFINDKNVSRSLLRGDLVKIGWKRDTIYIAGEGDSPQPADWLLTIKKIKDGKASRFRKEYKKPIKYFWSEELNFTAEYKNKLYLLVEYYLANSKQDLVKLSVRNRSNLIYSIEKQERDGKEYIALGISDDSGSHSSIIQWLYYDNEADKLHEYDLPNDKLVEFR